MGATRDRPLPGAEDSGRRIPKYEQIRDDLATAIRRGDYRPGDALPSQRELSASYGVTLMTLRQALQVLSDEGLVVQQPGRGTFIAPQKLAHARRPPDSMTDDLRSRGVELETRLLRLSYRRPSTTVRAALRLPSELDAMCIERLCIADGTPALHRISWVPEAYARTISDVDFNEATVHGALAECAGLAVSRSIEDVWPALATAEPARHLGIQVGSPVYLSERVTYDTDNHPLVFDRTTIAGAQVTIRTERETSETSWSWQARARTE
ncbi:GntR family transcriptional regulator [Gordonia sp. VNK21]|uniref:GntR family transcriptional regulator n=1 Tax=Gordonia sp. VNK21 TaxID=3382483 RepID=UPI0038D41D1C